MSGFNKTKLSCDRVCLYTSQDLNKIHLATKTLSPELQYYLSSLLHTYYMPSGQEPPGLVKKTYTKFPQVLGQVALALFHTDLSELIISIG